MTLHGGLRDRMVQESLYWTAYAALDTLGWFDVARDHFPVEFITEAYEPGLVIPPNTLLLLFEDDASTPIELGSLLSEDEHVFYFEFYAENESVMRHMMGDLKAICEGKHPAAGRTSPTLDVHDWSQATPPYEFSCDLERPAVRRSHIFDQPWEKHWAALQVIVVEERE